MLEDNGNSLFFGVGTGRCGTMTLSNLLNTEPCVIALHEGRFRHGEVPGEQLLPFLTLQNYYVYNNPHEAKKILRDARSNMEDIRRDRRLNLFGDIAYNYVPFVSVLADIFPRARLIFIYRDGRDFVRSAYTSEVPDKTPVGWLDQDRPQTRLEKYIALGRLRPRDDDPLSRKWESLSPVSKNAWLWSESNRLILDGLEKWPQGQVIKIRFESFFQDPLASYKSLRDRLGLSGPLPPGVSRLLSKKINARHLSVLPEWPKWKKEVVDDFWYYAKDMMCRLGYAD